MQLTHQDRVEQAWPAVRFGGIAALPSVAAPDPMGELHSASHLLRPATAATLTTMPWHRTDLPADPPNAPTLTPIAVAGRALVLSSAGGEWFAVEDRCSHAGCAFSEDGAIEGDRLICDCHGSEFDIRTGAVMAPPAVDPIATFAVRVSGGRLEVEL